MSDLISLLGTTIDIVRGYGTDHVHYKEAVLFLRGNQIITDRGTTISVGDRMFDGKQEFCIRKQKEVAEFVVFAIDRVNNVVTAAP